MKAEGYQAFGADDENEQDSYAYHLATLAGLACSREGARGSTHLKSIESDRANDLYGVNNDPYEMFQDEQ